MKNYKKTGRRVWSLTGACGSEALSPTEAGQRGEWPTVGWGGGGNFRCGPNTCCLGSLEFSQVGAFRGTRAIRGMRLEA